MKAFSIFISWLIVLLLNGFVISLLWNWLMVALFSLPSVTIVQGIGLFVLGQMLFHEGFKVKFELAGK